MTQAAEYISVSHAAKLLGVSPRTVYRYLDEKRLSRFERLGRVMLDRREVEELGAVRPVEPSSPPDATRDGA